MLKPQRRFEREKHNLFTEKVNKIALSASDHKYAINRFNRNICIWNEQRFSK